VARERPEFVFLTDRLPRPAAPLGLIARVYGVLPGALASARWATVSYRPAEGHPDAGRGDERRPTRGLVLTVGIDGTGGAADRLAARCLRRVRPALRGDGGVLALGGGLARHPGLAAELGRKTGRAVLAGLALEASALIEAGLVLTRWRGRDPLRARAVVLADPHRPELAQTATECLAERVGHIGLVGLDGPRRLALAERLRLSSGAVLELYRSPERGLEAADLVFVCGGAPRPDFGPLLSTAVVLDLGPAGLGYPGPVGPPAGPAAAASTGTPPVGPPVVADVVRLACRSRPGVGGKAETGDQGGPVRVGRVLFAAPPGWRGRPEPGLPEGFISAPLVEAVTTVRLAGAGPPARRALEPRWMEQLRRGAALLGFRPAALVAFPAAPVAPAVAPVAPAAHPPARFLDSAPKAPI